MKLITLSLLIVPTVMGQAPASPKAARIIVYQDFGFRSIPANPLFCDDVQVARLGHRASYFVLEVAPGEHSFRGKRKADLLIIDAAAGHDYYLHFVASTFNKFIRETQQDQTALDLIANGKLRPIDPSDVSDHSRVSLSLEVR